MITRDPDRFVEALDRGRFPTDGASAPRGVFLIEPANFQVNAETATDNRYMDRSGSADPDRALEQYVGLVARIREVGVPVKTFPGHHGTPDDVFPNNVFATLPGRLIIGRPRHASRRAETARPDIRAHFESLGYRTVDLSQQEGIAELTGPLVIDRLRCIGFCGMSPRVDEAGLDAMHRAFRLRCTLAFDLVAGEYHTNVILAVLAGRACVLHAGSCADARIPRAIAAVYAGRALWLDDAERDNFVGNCIALTPHDVFMSQRAADALRPVSRAQIESWGFRIRTVPLDEIEKAGGSLRCMVAEIY